MYDDPNPTAKADEVNADGLTYEQYHEMQVQAERRMNRPPTPAKPAGNVHPIFANILKSIGGGK